MFTQWYLIKSVPELKSQWNVGSGLGKTRRSKYRMGRCCSNQLGCLMNVCLQKPGAKRTEIFAVHGLGHDRQL